MKLTTIVLAVSIAMLIATVTPTHKQLEQQDKESAVTVSASEPEPESEKVESVVVEEPEPIVEARTWSNGSNWVEQCHVWAEEAGITLPASAIKLIDRESNCGPTAQNPRSTAYGIGQFLNSSWAGVGCVKNSDPINQLQCMKKYVDARYNGWDGAWAFFQANNYY